MLSFLFLRWIFYLSLTRLCYALVVSPPVSASIITARLIAQGWSLQSDGCPGETNACGNGFCCPSSLYCISPSSTKASACCTSTSECRDAIEVAPSCADSSWSLWQDFQGNSFCCEAGLVSTYGYSSGVAGTCISVAAATSAVLKSTGSDPALAAPLASAVTSDAGAPRLASRNILDPLSLNSNRANHRAVFFHYMIGSITDLHCKQDILDAQALGADAFALNLATVTAEWVINTVASLFNWANVFDFKLFFSFDMTSFNNPSQFIDFLQSYVTNPAHFKHRGLPFVSTFNGGTSNFTFGEYSVDDGWNISLQQIMANAGYPIYFVPAFQDAPNGSADFFATYPSVDGAMNWNSWPWENDGKVIVSMDDDLAYLIDARSSGKTFMMGLSPLQFKHIDSRNNWYRQGEQNLEYRIGQILALQPDFVEIQTWNDAGESHYMGNSWPEPIGGTNIGTYTADYDHTGYWQILPAFIKAYKAGHTATKHMFPTDGSDAQGVFWHHTLLSGANCGADPIGIPNGARNIEDTVTAIVLVAPSITDLRIVIWSGSKYLGSSDLQPGYNTYVVSGMTTGLVTATVSSSTGSTMLFGSGPIPVASSSSVFNYNFQVVALK